MAPKDTERQLSKKELKKKGLEELEAALAELGYTNKETSDQDGTHGNNLVPNSCVGLAFGPLFWKIKSLG